LVFFKGEGYAMSARGSYLLRVGGRLKGDLKMNSAILGEIRKFFGVKPTNGAAAPDNKPGDPWPNGFVLKGYHVCAWDLKDEEEAQQTVISFRTEAHHIQTGTLWDNRTKMIPEVQWFYHYPEYKWHMDLKAILQKWNQMIGQDKLIEQIWFRDWQWYCGNGGS